MHKLKEMAVKELRELEEAGSLTPHNLDLIVKLTKVVKNIDTINAMEESEYSNRMSHDGSYDGSYRGSYDSSYAVDRRGRNADGSYRMRNDGGRDQRYSYGYSRDIKEDLENLMHKAKGREKEMLEHFIKEF